MKSKVCLWPVLALAVTLTAQAQQGKFAVINIQGAIISTKDGQKAAAELNAKTAPKKKELEQKQNEINSLQDQLNKGSNTLSDTAKNDLYKNIEAKKKGLQREVEDAQADLEAATTAAGSTAAAEESVEFRFARARLRAAGEQA